MTVSVLVDRAGVATATTGSGTITLGAALGAVAANICSYETFAAGGVTDGAQVSYLILDSNGAWEVGFGTYTASGTTLTRTVTRSSNSNAALNLTGSAQVFVTARAEDIVTNTNNLPGTTTNDNATGGNIGEYISASVSIGSPVALTSDIGKNVTSISLTAGDWDIWGALQFTGGGTTVVNYLLGGIFTATNTTVSPANAGFFAEQPVAGTTLFATFGTSQPPTLQVAGSRVSLSGTTSYFLNAQAGFSVSTCSVAGLIQARRVR